MISDLTYRSNVRPADAGYANLARCGNSGSIKQETDDS
jgi:hypothetical protein